MIAVVPGALFEVRQPSSSVTAMVTDAVPATDASHQLVESTAPTMRADPLPAASKHPAPVGRWALARNPVAEAIPTAPRTGLAHGQLTLDSVIPVRNDLSDADLEVVKAATVADAAPGRSGEAAAAKSSRWSRVMALLFRFRKAQV